MDPISLTASVLAIVTAAAQASKGLQVLYGLRHAHHEISELSDELSKMQDLLTFVQKAVANISQSISSVEDIAFITGLIESGREPLSQLNNLIVACSRVPDITATDRGINAGVSKVKWFRLRNSVDKIRTKFVRVHHNLSTALIALNMIQGQETYFQRQQDRKLLLTIQSDQKIGTEEAISLINTNYSALSYQIRRLVIEPTNEILSNQDARMVSQQESSALRADSTRPPPSLSLAPDETRWQIVENQREPIDDHDNNCDSTGTYVRISALTNQRRCKRNCRCQCHIQKSLQSPQWLKNFLGAFFYSHLGVLFLRSNPCNYINCIQREVASCQLTYFFPSWMTTAFIVSASYLSLRGISASWSIGFPRTISASHEVWTYIERHRSDKLLQLLRKQLIGVNDLADDDGTSLLICSLKFRRYDITKLLLDHGANPYFVDPRGISACAYAQSGLLTDRYSKKASWSPQLDTVLNEYNITDDLCLTPLHYIVLGLESADLRQQLRLNKTLIDTPDALGRSPLHWAVILGDLATVEVLLEKGACPNTIDKEQKTPLHDIYLSPPASQAQTSRLLLKAGANFDSLDAWGRTALRVAAAFENINQDFLQTFLANGADIRTQDMYEQSPLIKSIRGSANTSRILLDNGADVEARDIYGNSPVTEAIYHNKPERLRLLLDHGARTDEYFELKPGRRARDGPVHILDFVAWYGSVEIMRVFEERKVDCNYRLLYPLDGFERFRKFRLANAVTTGPEELAAFKRLLSSLKFSYEYYSASNPFKAE